MKRAWKAVILLTIPFAVGFLLNRLMILGVSHPSSGLFVIMDLVYNPLAQIAFLFLWIWVGSRFALLGMKKVYSFLLGNCLNWIALISYVLLFYFLDGTARMTSGLVGFSQFGATPVLILGVKIQLLFIQSGNIDSRICVLISYVLLTLAFSVGFFYKAWRSSLSEKSGLGS